MIGENMKEKTVQFLESIVIVAIILVLIQTFLEDFSVLAGWSWNIRKTLVITGFCFDLFFTIEFLTRLFSSLTNRKGLEYIVFGKGWIDFMASVPLLMFNSGPSLLAVMAGGALFPGVGGFLNVLKVAKAIRIARVLRLLRVLKIFKQIKYADSVMAQRHIAKVTTLAITVFVLTSFLINLLSRPLNIFSAEMQFNEKYNRVADYISENIRGDDTGAFDELLNIEEGLLVIKDGGKTIFSRYDNSFYRREFGPADYQYTERGSLGFFFDSRDLLKLQSRDNIIFFTVVVILVIILLVYYSPHFAITVTDPIHVMRRGLKEKSYNLEVKVPDRYRDDDIFQMATLYNEVFLPLKDRSRAEEGGGDLELKIEDIKDIF